MTTVDPVAVLAALGIGDADEIVPVTTGFGGASLFRVVRRGSAYALRVYAPHAVEPADRELAAMEAARSGGVPVPIVHERGVWAERPVVLLEWSAGRAMLDELRRRPWRVVACGRLLGRIQAAIHAVQVSDDAPLLAGDWLAWRGMGETPLGQRLAKANRGRSLLHLDLHPLNVLVDGDRITGVIDWENASVGDPRADLARTWSMLQIAPVPPGPMRFVVSPLRRALESGWRRGYREAAGWPDDLALFNAWAAEVMARDLALKIGRPGIWFGESEIAEIRREAARWEERSGAG